MSYSFVLSGTGPVLSNDYFPVDISSGDWEIGLIDFSTYNSIPNITEGENNEITLGDLPAIQLPTGAYEIEDIERFIQLKVYDKKDVAFSLKPNINTLKAVVKCSVPIHFEKGNSIAPLLGFDKKTLDAKKSHESVFPVNIIKVNVITVECSIAVGSFRNGVESHILHEFYPQVPPGFKIVEIPPTVIYLPVNVKTVHNITVSVRDQNGRLIDFRNETVSVRLHLRQQNGPRI